jgi:hypothetical protein
MARACLRARAAKRRAALSRNLLGAPRTEKLRRGASAKTVLWAGFEPGPFGGHKRWPWLRFESLAGNRGPGVPLVEQARWTGFESGPAGDCERRPRQGFEHGSVRGRSVLAAAWVGDKEKVGLGLVCGGLAEYMGKVA